MSISISEDSPLYNLALATENKEKEVVEYVKDRDGRYAECIKVLEENALFELRESYKRSFNSELQSYNIYKVVGMSDKMLENSFSDFDNMLPHPIENSKDIEDLFIKTDIRKSYDSFYEQISRFAKVTRNQKTKNWLQETDALKVQLKGMEAKKNKNGIMSGTITLSRTTKGQQSSEYNIENACLGYNNKMSSLDNVVVWFRLRDNKIFWRYLVVSFEPKVFLVDQLEKLIRKPQKKDPNKLNKGYDYEKFKHARIVINPSASYQFSAACSDIRGFLTESDATILYDSLEG